MAGYSAHPPKWASGVPKTGQLTPRPATSDYLTRPSGAKMLSIRCVRCRMWDMEKQ